MNNYIIETKNLTKNTALKRALLTSISMWRKEKSTACLEETEPGKQRL